MMAVAVVVVAAAVAVLVYGPWWVWCGASAGFGAPALYQRLVMVDGSSSYEVHNIFTCLQATNRGKSRKMVIAGEKNTPTTNTWTDKFRRFFLLFAGSFACLSVCLGGTIKNNDNAIARRRSQKPIELVITQKKWEMMKCHSEHTCSTLCTTAMIFTVIMIMMVTVVVVMMMMQIRNS